MENYKLPLSQLTYLQKLDLLESLWDDLAGKEQIYQSPTWHQDVLRDREEALLEGKLSISDWEEAKARIRNKVS
ncbi:MAG: addiction module protein [Bacteroidales bacterium]|nr:addiction module protein [Bacteroidales bacterium]MCF8457400.1 addiction module protein [Bacteroidales bacterium]